MKTARYAITAIVAAVMLVFAMQSAATGVGAQATPSAEGEATARPAHIHAGSCPEVGEVVHALNDLTPPMGEATPVGSPDAMAGMSLEEASPAAMAGMTGDVVAESTTHVNASLDDILGGEHAINVHESTDNMGNYIACGDITGTPSDDGLHIQLQELNQSGFMGEAHLVDNGDGTTTVTVTLMASTSPSLDATPAG